MFEKYLCIKDKVIALDEKNNEQEYEYQDNIKEILEQENIIEKTEEILELAKREKRYHTLTAKFYDMITTEKYSNKIFGYAIIFLICLSAGTLGVEFSISLETLKIFGIFIAVSGGLVISTTIAQYKKFKKEKNIKIVNTEEQIKEFEKILEQEKEKLSILKQNKTMDKELSSDIHKLDNDSIKRINEIEQKKEIYNYYRSICTDIKKLDEAKENYEHKEELVEIDKKTNKVLSRKKLN